MVAAWHTTSGHVRTTKPHPTNGVRFYTDPLRILSAGDHFRYIITIARVIFHHYFLQRANLGWTVIYYSPYVD